MYNTDWANIEEFTAYILTLAMNIYVCFICPPGMPVLDGIV